MKPLRHYPSYNPRAEAAGYPDDPMYDWARPGQEYVEELGNLPPGTRGQTNYKFNPYTNPVITYDPSQMDQGTVAHERRHVDDIREMYEQARDLYEADWNRKDRYSWQVPHIDDTIWVDMVRANHTPYSWQPMEELGHLAEILELGPPSSDPTNWRRDREFEIYERFMPKDTHIGNYNYDPEAVMQDLQLKWLQSIADPRGSYFNQTPVHPYHTTIPERPGSFDDRWDELKELLEQQDREQQKNINKWNANK